VADIFQILNITITFCFKDDCSSHETKEVLSSCWDQYLYCFNYIQSCGVSISSNKKGLDTPEKYNRSAKTLIIPGGSALPILPQSFPDAQVFFGRHEFQKTILKNQARIITSWGYFRVYFVAMLYGQLAGQDSLRASRPDLPHRENNLYHLGAQPINRPSLSTPMHPPALFSRFYSPSCCQMPDSGPAPQIQVQETPSILWTPPPSPLVCPSSIGPNSVKRKGPSKLHVKSAIPAICQPSYVTTARFQKKELHPSFHWKKGLIVMTGDTLDSCSWKPHQAFFVTRLKSNLGFPVVNAVRKSTQHPADQIIQMIVFNTRRNIPCGYGVSWRMIPKQKNESSTHN